MSLVTPPPRSRAVSRARHTVEQLTGRTSSGRRVSSLARATARRHRREPGEALAQAPEARVSWSTPTSDDLPLARSSASGCRRRLDAILDPGLTSTGSPARPHSICRSSPRARSAQPYEVLKSPRLGDCSKKPRQYDYISSTPPPDPIQDCRVIGRWVDGFLLV